MSEKQYIPQRGEIILIKDFKEDYFSPRVFSHMKDVFYVCFNNTVKKDDTICKYTSEWKFGKRHEGEFHDDFQPVLIENKPLKLYL